MVQIKKADGNLKYELYEGLVTQDAGFAQSKFNWSTSILKNESSPMMITTRTL